MLSKPIANNKKRARRERIYFIRATQSGRLLEQLIESLPQASRTTLKQYLRNRCVVLQGQTTTQFDAPVSIEDTIEIYNIGSAEELRHPLISELYRDDYLIVLHKRPGIPTISVGGASKSSLFEIVAHHLKQIDPHDKIFLLNRLDRDTEGLIIVARDRQLQQDLLAEWHSFILSNSFEGVVLGSFENSKGELHQTSINNQKGAKGSHTRSAKSPKGNKRPDTFRATYQVISTGPYITRLNLSLQTRNNSIRSTLASLGHPLLGDTRASETIAPELSKHLALRATEITFYHPIRREPMQFTIETPIVNIEKISQTHLTKAQKETLQESVQTKDVVRLRTRQSTKRTS